MAENTSDLQGDNWLGNLKNPQGQSYETGQAEGLSDKKPEQPTDVAPQQ